MYRCQRWQSYSGQAPKAAADQADPTVQAWESLMWTYQQAIPGGAPGAKWQLMERIFELR